MKLYTILSPSAFSSLMNIKWVNRCSTKHQKYRLENENRKNSVHPALQTYVQIKKEITIESAKRAQIISCINLHKITGKPQNLVTFKGVFRHLLDKMFSTLTHVIDIDIDNYWCFWASHVDHPCVQYVPVGQVRFAAGIWSKSKSVHSWFETSSSLCSPNKQFSLGQSYVSIGCRPLSSK